MQRSLLAALMLGAGWTSVAAADPLSLNPSRYAASSPTQQAPLQSSSHDQPHLGGGFIQFVFGSTTTSTPTANHPTYDPGYGYNNPQPEPVEDPSQYDLDPRFQKQLVPYAGEQKPGTVIIDTRERFLYLVQPGGKALRYGVGVGRPGFVWNGIKEISAKREWPDWRPPDEMLKRRPDLPGYMAGGPQNPLGARALYLGSSLYRIHGSNEPWTIGTQVSSGCIRMRNEDVIDLYDRVKVGTKVVVI
jgi:lipoprotein-anchoring transpeptidase ErfK/SrfK